MFDMHSLALIIADVLSIVLILLLIENVLA
jgi:hypothetical protein